MPLSKLTVASLDDTGYIVDASMVSSATRLLRLHCCCLNTAVLGQGYTLSAKSASRLSLRIPFIVYTVDDSLDYETGIHTTFRSESGFTVLCRDI